jgi:LacI family transcriptional regulator
MEASEALAYAPNAIARDLRAGARSNFVGLVIGNLDNPFYARLAAGVSSVLTSGKYELLMASSDDMAEHERQLLSAMISRRVRGLIVVPSGDDYSFLAPERNRGTGIVFVDRPPVGLDAGFIVVDNRAGVRQAVEHLADHGHRRIAMLADARALWTSRERVAAFRDTCAARGIDVAEDLVVTELSTVVDARRATIDLALSRTPPTAIVAGNNLIATGALEGMRRSRRRLALVSFDDFDASELLEVTTLSHAPQDIGIAAATALLSTLADGGGLTPSTLVIKTTLIPRGSGELNPEDLTVVV